ncbi:hypothetical protein [Brumimicrobium mesophilum]|uniref:hypothetical protein n=1 Tax=Brumimicrobium mesophilum TaxID=392717 RepID=UPI000D141033|nr:hypothetical protein [Brumimicrobium mesophilum]
MKNLLVILLIAFLALGCKKENKIEKNLWNNGGEWEIKSFEQSAYKIPASQFDYSTLISNGGSIQFNKDGTGKFKYSEELAEYLEIIIYEEQINADFTYHFTENSIFFIFTDAQGAAFDLEWEEDKMIYSHNETHVDYDLDQFNDTIPGSKVTSIYSMKFNCEKK